jgi:Nsp2, transmembrane domain
MVISPPISVNLPELVARTQASGKITLLDRYELMVAMVDNPLTAEDIQVIDHLLRAVCQGKVKIVDTESDSLPPAPRCRRSKLSTVWTVFLWLNQLHRNRPNRSQLQ